MASADLNELLNALLPFAERMLTEHSEFFPFAATMKPDGETTAVGAYDGDEHTPSQVLIDLLADSFRRQAQNEEIKAAGICYDVRTIPPGQNEKCDAVCCSLEHRTGEALDVYLPYWKTTEGCIQYGEMFAARRTPQFFVSHGIS
jgi:hypothetical protein